MPRPDNADAQLVSLLSTERAAISHLASADPDAATLLASNLSGYATVRHFYNLRDQAFNASSPTTSLPLQQKRRAATALLAAIESAADCIRGGLFDPAVESAVPVSGLLVLLGETLPLLGLEKRVFTREQVWGLLRVVEDWDTAPSRIRENGEALLKASVEAFRGGVGSSGVLRKTRGQGSGSGSDEGLEGSSWDMLLASSSASGQSLKGMQTDVRRGWDWRKGLDAVVGADMGGKEVLMLVRTALAREVGRGWSGQINW